MTALPFRDSPLQRLRHVWSEFAAFLRKPELIQPCGLREAGALATFWSMAMLHLIVMTLLVPVLSIWQVQGSTGAPTAFSAVPQEWLLPLVIFAAPVMEEVIFRGWLRGLPRTLWLLVIGALSVLPLAFAGLNPLLSGGLMLACWIAMLAGWIKLRKNHAAPRWFSRHFAVIFYLMVLAFGLMHISNYDHPGLATVPMVLPQLWCGLALGFVRMRIGLTAAILMHGLSNGIVLGLAQLGH